MDASNTQIRVNPTTRLGEDISSQIASGESAYGKTGLMTIADMRTIIDSLHTHFLDNGGNDELLNMLSNWMAQIDSQYDINTL